MSQVIRLQMPELHPCQKRMRATTKRYNVAACGRRFGKTVFGIDVLIDPALRGYPAAWFSPTYKALAEIEREIVNTVQPIISKPDRQEHRYELYTGGVLDLWSLEGANRSRGRHYKTIVIDEAAQEERLQDIWDFILRPMLLDLSGNAWFLSTPKGLNAFYHFWLLGDDEPDWGNWHFTTYDNPKIPKEEIDALRRTMPERVFRQEILAEFLESGVGVFRRIDDAAVLEPQPPVADKQYVIGVDWGRVDDFTVFAVIAPEDGELVFQDRFNNMGYEIQTSRLKALCERYRPTVVLAEANAMGQPLIESLQADGLPVRPFVTSHMSKARIIEDLALAFERGTIQILNDRALINELRSYDVRKTASDLLVYGAPPGVHDDCVMALALAWHAAQWTGTTEEYMEIIRAW